MPGFYRLRESVARPWIPRGALFLDVGCGCNSLARGLGGIGVDFLPRSRADVLALPWSLPFRTGSFGTAVSLAVLNYIPRSARGAFVKEVLRVLDKGGLFILTVITPLGSFIHRMIRRHEPKGMSQKAVRNALESQGFALLYSSSFMLGLNELYVFRSIGASCASR